LNKERLFIFFASFFLALNKYISLDRGKKKEKKPLINRISFLEQQQ